MEMQNVVIQKIDLLGWFSYFLGYESGQIHSVKLIA